MLDLRMQRTVLYLFLVLAFPLVILAALLTYFGLRQLPERQMQAAGGAALAGLLLLAALNFSLAGVFWSEYQFAAGVGRSVHQAVENVKEISRAGAPAQKTPKPKTKMQTYFSPARTAGSAAGWGLILGGLAAAVMPGRRRPGAGRPSNKLTWAEKRALNRITKQEHPPDGVLLGVEQGTGKPVIVTDAEMNHHCFLVGTTGAGKTTTILNFVQSAVQRCLPLVLVDGKGDPGLAERVRALAEAAGRPFKLFSMSGPSAHYNPLAHGGITELKDKLLYLTEWSEPHYEALAGRYLQLVFRVFSLSGVKPDLTIVGQYLDPDTLALLARQIQDVDQQQAIFDILDSFKTAEIRGLAARLAAMTESEIGHLFEATGDVIDLNEIIQRNGVVVFSLDSLSFPEYSRLLGRLIVADLKSVAARAYRRERKTIYTIFDEFNVFASPAVVDLIGKARGAGFHTLIATQSLADIESAAGIAAVDQVVENCNTYIIQRQNSPKSAETSAAIIGTREDVEVTTQVHRTPIGDFGSGMGTVRNVREFVVHPDEIKALGTGEAVLLRKNPLRVQWVRIRNIS
ncbi:type IV secretory system conjugative DNA transfer family protein [Thermodesulfitimonas autotrophica]|uniref:type IV secretory system conjugative DNA transfer family protein n=1 Tax=Thermodesulfitimonas autotrophica TaxID=1894989 RepID=UPI002FE1F449